MNVDPPMPFASALASTGDGAGPVQVFRSVAELPADASALMESCARDSLAFGPGWMGNLERTVFPDHPGLRYCCLRDATGALQAVLPLIRQRGRWSEHASALGNWYTALYQPALVAGLRAEQLVVLFDALRRQSSRPFGALTLAPMALDGGAYALLESALQHAGFGSFRYYCFGNWYLSAPDDWEQYLASRNSKLRSTIKRMRQKLQADGGSVELITSAADLPRGLAAYDAVYAKSWKNAEPSPDFIPGLMRLCAERQALRLGIVWLQGQAVAVQFWFVTGRRAEIYKVAYDEAYKAYSPGTVLTAHLMQHVLTHDRVAEVDYLIGDDAYKRHWMSHRRERWGLVAHNLRSAPGLLGYGAERVRRAVKATLQAATAWRARRAASAAGDTVEKDAK